MLCLVLLSLADELTTETIQRRVPCPSGNQAEMDAGRAPSLITDDQVRHGKMNKNPRRKWAMKNKNGSFQFQFHICPEKGKTNEQTHQLLYRNIPSGLLLCSSVGHCWRSSPIILRHPTPHPPGLSLLLPWLLSLSLRVREESKVEEETQRWVFS